MDSASVATFASEKPLWKRRTYQAAFPLLRMVMKRAMNITPETGQLARETVGKFLDLLADKSAATGYLVGTAFSVADLTAAALLGPVALYDYPDMRQAEPRPARFAALCAGWAEHPAIKWAHEICRKHRPPRRGVVIS